jgi:hypothetical protein
VLERAVVDDASRRPSARRLAADLAAVGAPADGPTRDPRAIVRAGFLVVGALVGVLLLRSAGREGAPPRSGTSAPTVATPSSSTSTTLPPCVVGSGTRAGDGCAHQVEVDGRAVVVDGRRAVVARAGDQVLVGDWGCEGTPRPAVLRPTTGEVLVYAPLDAPGGPAVLQAERLDGAQRLTADVDEAGCPTLLVITAGGTVRLT